MRMILSAVFLCVLCRSAFSADKKELWIYSPTNLQVHENVGKLQRLWERAADAGYDHILLTDSKFAKLKDDPKEYFENCAKVKEIAGRLKMQIVPAMFDVGYSNDVLWNDPNLAEGLPVKDALFTVKDGQAGLVPDPPVSFGKVEYSDPSVHIADRVATVKASEKNSRFMYKLTLPPYRCYHISALIKTDGYSGHPEIKANGADERELNWKNLGVARTQDWTRHDIVFNTLNNKEVTIIFGVWVLRRERSNGRIG